MNRAVRVVVVRLALLLLAACALAAACWLDRRPAGAGAGAPDAYACAMHPQVQAATPGDCSICGMALERNERAHGHAQDVVAFPGAPSDAARFVSYGRGPVQRRTLRSPLDAPAWVDAAERISALLYEDELRALGAGAATFEAASGPCLAVSALAEPAVRWDHVRWRVSFRAEHALAALAAGSVGRLRAALAPREVLAVLSAAVLPSAEGPAVLVVSPDRRGVSRRPIELGRAFSGYTSVLSGVAEGELVVVMNAFFLDAERRLEGTESDAGGARAMMARLLGWCSRQPRLVLAIGLLCACAGLSAARALGRDVIPDLSEPQIVLVVDWMGHPVPEVARDVTQVLTALLETVPGARDVRGCSMSGMAYLDVVFDSPASLPAGRAAILERLAQQRARLPAEAQVEVGPAVSSTSWVFQYALVDRSRRSSPLSLRAFQDDVLRPALSSLPGVAEVASLGGGAQQVLVQARMQALRARQLAFTDLLAPLRSALRDPRTSQLEQLATIPISGSSQPGAQPVPLGDLAEIQRASDMPNGLADLGDGAPAVGGIVIAERDAHLPALREQVESTLSQKVAAHPGQLQLVIVHDRLELANRVGGTLLRALLEEMLVVALVILVFLLHGKSALIPLLNLPLVLLLTCVGMWLAHVPATIMSLGGIGIALGLAVDAEVVALESGHRQLELLGQHASSEQRRAALVSAALAFTPAIITSLLITALSFLPALAFGGETGRLLRPLVLTKTLIIVASVLVALTTSPALRVLLLGGPLRAESEHPLLRALIAGYRPVVTFALERPALSLLTAALAVGSCLPLLPRLGGEFLPRIDEGDLLFMPTTLPGASPMEAGLQLRAQDRALALSAEVETVFGKLGRADTATDPAPYSMAETILRLKPRAEWPLVARARWYSSWAPPALAWLLGLAWPEQTPLTRAELLEKLDRASALPGWTSAWTAPVRARQDMMSTGVRTPLSLRIVASSPERLNAIGSAARTLLLGLDGTRSAVLEAQSGETRLAFEPDLRALELQHVDPDLARSSAELMLAGGQVGQLQRDQRRLRVRVSPAPDPAAGGLSEHLGEITVRAAGPSAADPVPLALLGRTKFATYPASLRSERGELVTHVLIDLVEGADLVHYVDAARGLLKRAQASGELVLAPGERLEWAGQYELFAQGLRRLCWILPLVVLLMLALLFLQFRSWTESMIVMASIPFALVGSIWALFLLDYSFSAPVWVGLLSVLGLAMQTGVVMVVYIDTAFYRRLREGKLQTRADIIAAHAEGTIQRLRPKLMTVSTMGAGLLPLLWADGPGAEVLRRVAAPMLGGLATSAFLTLEVLPVLYTLWRQKQLRHAQKTGVPLEQICGSPPPWARV